MHLRALYLRLSTSIYSQLSEFSAAMFYGLPRASRLANERASSMPKAIAKAR